MTAADLTTYLGYGTLLVVVNGATFRVPVEVIVARAAYGRVDVLVQQADAQAWVSEGKVEREAKRPKSPLLDALLKSKQVRVGPSTATGQGKVELEGGK